MAPSSATIMADASFCSRSRVGGWAVWMIADGLPSAIFSGPFKTAPRGSAEAETMAIVNGMHVAVREGYVERGSEVLLQSDCMVALGLIRQAIPSAVDRKHPAGAPTPTVRKTKAARGAKDALAHLVLVVTDLGLQISVRHVKGHKEGRGRQWVNRQCDIAARREMRMARARKVQQGKPEEQSDG